MSFFWSTSRKGKIIESGLDFLELAISMGLLSGSAVVGLLGNFLLAGIFCALAIGMFFRLRRRVKRKI